LACGRPDVGIILIFFTSIPEFRLLSNACSAATGREVSFPSYFMRLCVLARASAFTEDDMRHLLVCACVCLLAPCGIARAAVEANDEVPSVASIASEHSVPTESVARRPTAKRVVARSDREICDTLITSAQSNQLPIPFFIRLLFQESGFKPDVISRAGAQGIAQFMPETASRVGLENPFDPMQAIAASARLLRDLVNQFGNLGLAAAAYNAGPRRIQDWFARKGKLPDETQHYVKTITGRPAENWKAATAVTPLQNVPREAPCQEATGVAPASAPQLDQPGTRMRTASVRARAPVYRSAKRERGSTQLAAARKKRHEKVRLSQR
jgi:uncharacterized protein (DUF2267 family)